MVETLKTVETAETLEIVVTAPSPGPTLLDNAPGCTYAAILINITMNSVIPLL